MLNFHKYSFLDVKHLSRIIKELNFHLVSLDPKYLFIWSDLYHPLICYKDEFCYIRLNIINEGICYYPPLGSGNLNHALFELMMDAKDIGVDFRLTSFDDQLINLYNLEFKDNKIYNNYIYSTDSFMLFNNKNYKKQLNRYNKFIKLNKVYYKKALKEDFTNILEFISIWSLEDESRKKDIYFYPTLNMIKKIFEHLYELDFTCVIILDELGKIYGISLYHINNNVGFIHLIMTLNIDGLYEMILSSTSKLISKYAKFINLESHLGNIDKERLYDSLHPLKIEKYYEYVGD